MWISPFLDTDKSIYALPFRALEMAVSLFLRILFKFGTRLGSSWEIMLMLWRLCQLYAWKCA